MSAVPSLGGVRALIDALPAACVSENRAEREAASADLYSAGAICAAVVRPSDVAEVSTAVRVAAEAGLAVLPRGAGLTYTGGYVPPHERCIVLDLARLNRIVEVSARDMYVTVEAGCTWKQVYDALDAHDLRLPCFGTHSGALSTVGGGLSGGAVFFGTARYGTVADSLLGLEVVLADGTRVTTGQGGFRNVSKPAYRTYGPDLTGLFVHDAGTFGIKTRATFRVIRKPAATGYGSWAFATLQAAAAALSEVARGELAEDAYVLDPASTRRGIATADLRQALRTLRATLVDPDRLWRRAASAARLLKAGTAVGEGAYSLHVVCAARSPAALRDDLDACRRAALEHGGVEIADTIPRGARANLFPPVNGVLGPGGERWVALNAKVAHSDADDLTRRSEAVLAVHAARLQGAGVTVSRMLMALSNHSFSYEPVFHWRDEWLPLHRLTPERRHLAGLRECAPNPAARRAVHDARNELLRLFADVGAASNQIGRTYPYLDSLLPGTRALLERLKAAVDPMGQLNPGALGLPSAVPAGSPGA
jgi:D-lactate dehydrogenase (cytochrome)